MKHIQSRHTNNNAIRQGPARRVPPPSPSINSYDRGHPNLIVKDENPAQVNTLSPEHRTETLHHVQELIPNQYNGAHAPLLTTHNLFNGMPASLAGTPNTFGIMPPSNQQDTYSGMQVAVQSPFVISAPSFSSHHNQVVYSNSPHLLAQSNQSINLLAHNPHEFAETLASLAGNPNHYGEIPVSMEASQNQFAGFK